MPQDLTDDSSTLLQVMAWCRQAASHYLNQCWPWSLSPYCITRPRWVNTLRPRQNGRHFADGIFKCIFLNGNGWISLKISLKFVPMVLINNISALVQISEPMMVSQLTHICVTRPQWVEPILRGGLFREVPQYSYNPKIYSWVAMMSTKGCLPHFCLSQNPEVIPIISAALLERPPLI